MALCRIRCSRLPPRSIGARSPTTPPHPPPGAGGDATTASAALIWRRPRWARRLQPGPVADLLAESQALGLVGRGAISGPGRALLAETTGPATESNFSIDAMTRALPKPIDHFLI